MIIQFIVNYLHQYISTLTFLSKIYPQLASAYAPLIAWAEGILHLLGA